MGKINVLSFAVANLIAAGEVVDRPSSVIKELMENSIDAGADRITVEIQNGGVSLMRVSDNGCGIEAEDLPVALRRHATSKIKEAEDLSSIMSLGFRGEALAAIASVSNVRIISKPKDSPFGAMVEAHAGNIIGVTERGASDGTTVIVEDLFYNVPARRKFLKKDVTEAMAVVATVEKLALSHPDISFRLISDGTTRLESSGDGKLLNTIYSIFGKDFASKLLPVDSIGSGIKISGYIGRSDNVRANRNYQNFFVNGRYVKSKTAMAAIEQAFSSYIPPEKFPCCVLFIDIDPRTVDVNVHPAKLEVKFSDEKAVFESVYYSVRNSLEKNTSRPQVELESSHISASEYRNLFTGKTQTKKTSGFATKKDNPLRAFVPIADSSKSKPEQMKYENLPRQNIQKSETNTPTPSTSQEKTKDFPNIMEEPAKYKASEREFSPAPSAYFSSATSPVQAPPTDSAPGFSLHSSEQIKDIKEVEKEEETQKTIDEYRIIGEAFDSYILIDIGQKLLIIDKHAAHERIIFENFKKIMQTREQASQMLMLPIDVILGRDESSFLSEYKNEIESVGFTFSINENSIQVHSIPTGIEPESVPEIMQTFADRLKNDTGNVSLTRTLVFEKALYQASCKAALKAGRKYAGEHIEWICEKIMEIPDITFCPHGRPIAVEMSKNMLDKQFERL